MNRSRTLGRIAGSRYPFSMADEPAGGGGGNPPPKPDEPVEIELQGGVKIKLPKDQAEVYTAARSKDKQQREDLARKAGTLEEERRAESEKARRAIEDAEALKLAKAGEVEKMRETLTRETSEKVSKLQSRYRDRALEAAIRAAPGLLQMEDAAAQKRLVEDILGQIKGTSTYDLDADALVINGADGRPLVDEKSGQPIGADAYVTQWLEARPYYRGPAASTGSGSGGARPKTPTGTKTVTKADLAAGRVDADDLRTGKVVLQDE